MITEQIRDSVQKRFPSADIVALAGDGSNRSYYRVQEQGRHLHVLMALSNADGERLARGCYDWTEIAATLAANDIPCPAITATLPNAILIEDCGNHTLSQVLTPAHRDRLFAQCFEIAARMLAITPTPEAVWVTRKFTKSAYLHEFEFFQEMFLDRALQLKLSPTEQQTLRADFSAVSEFLADFSNYFVHKDYHTRNLMVMDGYIKVIDFQDACTGSPLYDLISLCFDSYVPLETTTRVALFQKGRQVIEKNLGTDIVATNDAHWATLLLQRQLKAIGSFAKLTLVAKKGDYLQYVRPALATFPREEIRSPRWAFLSETLLNMIAERLNHTGLWLKSPY